jgi:hypothetical protein
MFRHPPRRATSRPTPRSSTTEAPLDTVTLHERIIALYQSGLTVKATALRLHVDPRAVTRALGTTGIAVRPRSTQSRRADVAAYASTWQKPRPPGMVVPVSRDDQLRHMLALVAVGTRHGTIAAIYGISRIRVIELLRKAAKLELVADMALLDSCSRVPPAPAHAADHAADGVAPLERAS